MAQQNGIRRSTRRRMSGCGWSLSNKKGKATTMLVFDLETEPVPEERLRELLPTFDESSVEVVKGEFDPSTVKVGNLKDPAKIAEKVESAKQIHETMRDAGDSIITEARQKHWDDFVSRAALSPITGQILVIGYYATESGKGGIHEGPESELIVGFWKKYEECRASHRRLVGHNIAGFDIPFLVRRSWMLDIPVPSTVFDKGKWLDSTTLADTMSLWGCGNRDAIKLGEIAQAFGVGAKTEGVTGADFARLYRGSEEDRAVALKYAANDVEITAKVAVRMGLV